MADVNIKPKHNYKLVLSDLRNQLYTLPKDVVQFAYAFRDFCKVWYPGDYDKHATIGRYFPMEDREHYGENLYVKYRVRIVVETHSTYHNDSETTETITVEVRSPFTSTGYLGPEHLPWDKRKYKPRKVGRDESN